MRNPNTRCSVCVKQLYRRPFEFKDNKEFCCRPCRSKLYQNKPSIWKFNLSLGRGWNKGMSKLNGDVLRYGKPRTEETKKLISKSLTGRTFSETHRQNISKTRIELYDKIGRKPNRTYKWDTKYQQWRQMILSRDNFTCQKCGSKENLQTHHIKKWVNYPELRYDLDNGLALCVFCHRKTDTWGNKGGK